MKMPAHQSVLLQESLDLLSVKEEGTYVDLTLGRGGHSAAILSRLNKGHLYAFDLDKEAIKESEDRLRSISPNFTLIHDNFRNMKETLSERGVDQIDGLLMDLGVSSPQFDVAERGFSYREEAPLDMRMDTDKPFSAKDIVNTYSLEELAKIFREYGEDPDAYAVSKLICKEREKKEIVTTTELVEIIKKAKGKKTLHQKGHPAKQIFQALRIETNGELDNLIQVLSDFPSLMKDGGTVVAISFHSLEDRLIKNAFRSLTVIEGNRHEELPLQNEEAPFIALTKKPITASQEELAVNHRAASAKLRAIKKKENTHHER